MSVIFGSARRDENGNYHGGRAGDNNGQEVATENFYMHSKGWIGLRAAAQNIQMLNLLKQGKLVKA